MMKFRGVSTRITNGHRSTFYSKEGAPVALWANGEVKAGFSVQIFEIQEVLLTEMEPQKPEEPEKVKGEALCVKGHRMKGMPMCPTCGELQA